MSLPASAPARPFRAEHVGSLLRPERLRQAREDRLAGKMEAGALRAVEDECIREAVALQQRVGLRVVTDGEFRRTNWRDGFFLNVEGFSDERQPTSFEFTMFDGTRRRATPVPRVTGRLRRRSGIATGEFEFLRDAARGTAKATLPAPAVMHFFGGPAAIKGSVYGSIEEYMADVARIFREELGELGRMGCRYVQFDDVALPLLCDPGVRGMLAQRGEDPDQVIDLYIGSVNAALADRPAGMTIAAHLCRGNHGHGMGSGGYEPIAERVFGGMAVDGFLLEYDSARAGGFEPLRFLPAPKWVALGLITTKHPEVEPLDLLRRRIDEATAFVPLERLALCPQCGFASGFRYDRLAIADEERKLARLVETADAVWGGD